MSYPHRFDPNQFENAPAQSANNAAPLPNNNGYQGQYDSFHTNQSYGQMPAPVSYPNPSVQPANVFLPPIDFSVPPPNFGQVNVSIMKFFILLYLSQLVFNVINCFETVYSDT